MTASTVSTPPSQETRRAGKYLTFLLGREYYGIEVLKVREIIRMTDITEVPHTPCYIKGVINLRGKVIPVIELCEKFGLTAAENRDRTCIVVVEVVSPTGLRATIGLIVDAVEEVVSLAGTDIGPPPDFGPRLDTDGIHGVANLKGQVHSLLHIDRIMAGDFHLEIS